MSVFFPRAAGSDQGFTPLFRLLEDFDSYKNNGQPARTQRGHLPTFQPKFDVRETGDSYELHGELPGMDKKNVNIEFSDPQTMVVRGRVERSYTEGTPPVIEEKKTAGAITEGSEEAQKRRDSRQATVEDDAEEFTEVSPVTSREEQQPKKPKDSAKYWVSERSIGEFSRSFNFPGHVDPDAVSASLRDGILNVTVPKAKKPNGRRIRIE
ncbi:Hsp20/alpha crystallin family protein [Candidatus Bathyarchaeota archaeon]|nr:Hsp20/alpha crystallin family protein [Candidatus Bathyarchaeota archaeon]